MPFDKQTFVYKQAECPIECDVYTPKGDYPVFPDGQPVLIFCRMSGFIAFNRDVAGQHWWHSGTRRGYVVVNIDHRLAPQVKIDGIFQDVVDCIAWVKTTLPTLIDTKIKIDPGKIIMAGGSAGGHLSLLSGFLASPPLAILSLYPLADPSSPGMADASPDPPPGRKKKIEYSEVSQYMDEVGGEVSSRGEVDDLDMHSFASKGRGAALLYVGQEGLLYPSCYGTDDVDAIREKWSIPYRLEHAESYPPCFLIHSKSDFFNSPDESINVSKVLNARGFKNELWLVDDSENSVERGGKGRPLQHSFDASDMGGSETSGLEKMFAKRVWDEFLGPLIA